MSYSDVLANRIHRRNNRAMVAAPAQPMIARLLATLGTPKRVPDTPTQHDSRTQLSSVKSHHAKIKMVKERRENGRFIFKDLKQCLRLLKIVLQCFHRERPA